MGPVGNKAVRAAPGGRKINTVSIKKFPSERQVSYLKSRDRAGLLTGKER